MDEAEFEKMRKALVKTNPSRDQNSATPSLVGKELVNGFHHPGHGKTGSGKTVLAGAMVDKITSYLKSAQGKGSLSCYYYCHYSRNQDETAPFLGWVLSCLCRHTGLIPYMLKTHLREDPETELSIKQLLECIEAVLLSLKDGEKAFVVLDAVDESKNRTGLLMVIAALGKEHRFRKVPIAVTSRRYSDIQEALKDVSMHLDISPFVNHDIVVYVRETIGKDRRFTDWPTGLQENVTKNLTARAQGMFLYARCQLDILADCGGSKEVSTAIAHLPSDLYGTYDKILSKISKRNRPAVRDIFALLMAGITAWWQKNLESASLIVKAVVTANPEQNGFFSEKALVQACGPLISINEQRTLTFAHYTVREYFRSRFASKQQKIDPALTDFATIHSQREQIVSLIYVCLASNLSSSSGTKDRQLQDLKEIALRSVHASIVMQPEILASSKEHMKLAIEVLGPFRSCTSSLFPKKLTPAETDKHRNMRLERLWINDFDFLKSRNPSTEDRLFAWHISIKPSTSSATLAERKPGQFLVLLATNSSKSFLDEFFHSIERTPGIERKQILSTKLTVEINSPTPSDNSSRITGSLLEIFSEGLKRGHKTKPILRRLLTEFADYHPDLSRDLTTQVILHNHSSRCQNPELCGIRHALSSQADINNPNVQYTPLQIASAALDVETVKLLLQNGADPNQIGKRTWSQPEIRGIKKIRNRLFDSNPKRSFPLDIKNEAEETVKGVSEGRSWGVISKAGKEIREILVARGASRTAVASRQSSGESNSRTSGGAGDQTQTQTHHQVESSPGSRALPRTTERVSFSSPSPQRSQQIKGFHSSQTPSGGSNQGGGGSQPRRNNSN
ncbi:hypothetical protein QBC38DRAFT_517805 [Podospora fimiseda]|uniref:Nephrocystin 3-like N-terminal domain-containing protein n=1 Tax=Podospora fimiseda TaxID=252190 RepID=A0AAN7BGU0_9PEZI|nr:hypothetical protein QBC38DRAFT_517805 [Podospora fimiseda]